MKNEKGGTTPQTAADNPHIYLTKSKLQVSKDKENQGGVLRTVCSNTSLIVIHLVLVWVWMWMWICSVEDMTLDVPY